MNLDELQSVRDRERQTDKLQQLRASFYADAGEFIQQLREQRERAAERADDPFDAPEVNRLTDEIDTAETTVEAIYEKRVGKIVKAASFAAADLPAESEGMTDEEEELFETLVGDIKDNRERVLDVLAGETSGNDTGASAPEAASTEQADPAADRPDAAAVDAADVMGEGTATGPPAGSETASETPPGSEREPPAGSERPAPDPPGTSGADGPDGRADRPGREEPADGGESEPPVRNDGGGIARETVRITDDVGEIVGLDERDYDLSAEDVVSLPAKNADLLVERDAAEPL